MEPTVNMCTCARFATFLAVFVCRFALVSSFLVGCKEENCGEPVIPPQALRIVGGHESISGSLPWTVMLVWCDFFRCGGAILSSQFILTAAHCFDEPRYPCFRLNSKETRHPSNWTVFAGKQNAIRSNTGEMMFEVEEIFIHPLYHNHSHRNDIALLRLKTNITYTSLIRPICLPTSSQVVADGQPCIVAGYGETLAAQTFSLNQVTVKVISDKVCTQPDWYGPSYYDPPEQFCAGFEHGGKDACDGDSGSPLVCDFDGKWYASGIVSKGFGCAAPKRPGVYTNVSYHDFWIRTTLAANVPGPLCLT
ncbi:hypothetical protein V1264_011341 [Littorina saxatilis]|uniref:Peptidase S1 domain-containing protein n=2 Tax=Littorina saxatilis TaxID=31220 RepID=A0AAN9BUS8_9CAEN